VIQIYRIRRPSSSFALCCNGKAWQRLLNQSGVRFSSAERLRLGRDASLPAW